jgi:hypothetical protein
VAYLSGNNVLQNYKAFLHLHGMKIRLLFLSISCFIAVSTKAQVDFTLLSQEAYPSCKPLTRWWWFAATIDKASIADNLYWLKERGFGGVEIAWVYPLNRMDKDTINYTPRQAWLSKDWTDMVAYAKHCADSLNMSCDFTFGSLWPFGDTKVPRSLATQKLRNRKWRQEITASWDYPKKGLVLDHLSKEAFEDYAERTGKALMPAMAGSTSAIFCDSWEVETKYLGNKDFLYDFKQEYRYSLKPFLDSLYCKAPNIHRYRYMKMLSTKVLNNFYIPFSTQAHKMFALSRAQVCGAPVDIIEAYKQIDIPETEAMLYEPKYGNIVASAAALSNKNIVSAEAFTCLYGWPRNYMRKEQTADLKLVADALFANGVNQIVWHGKPYTPKGTDLWRFYASVHLGDSSALASELKPFNAYLTKVSTAMRKGVNYSDIAVYLPLEDNWMRGELPTEQQYIWAWGYYELRDVAFPKELKPYRPMWVNEQSIREAVLTDSGIVFSKHSTPCKALCIASEYLDGRMHELIVQCAKKGFPIFIKSNYNVLYHYTEATELSNIKTLSKKFRNVHIGWDSLSTLVPVLSGAIDFDFWIREDQGTKYIFCAQPKAKDLAFPIEYGQAFIDSSDIKQREIVVHHNQQDVKIALTFNPYQSILLKVKADGTYDVEDIIFEPKVPTVIVRDKAEKVKWKLYPEENK